MEKHNADMRRYLREMYRALPCSRMKKKIILAPLEESINEFAVENTDLDYAAMVARFGTPQQVAVSCLEEMESSEVARNLQVKRKIVGILLAAAVVAVLLWACVVFSAKAKLEVDTDGYFEEKIIDVTRIPDNGRGEN